MHEKSRLLHEANMLTLKTRRGVNRGQMKSGQAILELTLITPFLIMLTILSIDFGGWLYCWTQIGDAARAVANYAVLGPGSAGSPIPANPTTIQSLLDNDLATLPNYSSGSNPTVSVCWKQNGTVTPILTTTCSSPADDPEATSSYVAVTVDIAYTYTPLISAFTFTNLGIHIPTLPTSIRRRIVMRLIT